VKDMSHDVGLRLGAVIRARRRQLGLTLVDVAAQAGLSHPFLSQLERGLARPSMRSLSAIAATLGTTAQVLMVEADLADSAIAAGLAPVSVIRAGSGSSAPVNSPGGTVHALVRGERAMLPVEYVGAPSDFDEYYQHPGEEFVYVVRGQIELDIEDEVYAASPGDSIYYAGAVRHRWRSRSDEEVRLVVVQQNLPPYGPGPGLVYGPSAATVSPPGPGWLAGEREAPQPLRKEGR
jgi:transcriptional regulator with XRE-family HTH domain/mannose-6-phosphate isomerase-like protein (cupin superfamily)